MDHSLDPLIRDLVEWVARAPRPYAEMIDVWRTSCPRLTVWEDAEERGLVERRSQAGQGVVFVPTPSGLAFLGAQAATTMPVDGSEGRVRLR